MTTIAANQRVHQIRETTLGRNLASTRDWVPSFLDFQISKLEERCVKMPAEIDPKVGGNQLQLIWN